MSNPVAPEDPEDEVQRIAARYRSYLESRQQAAEPGDIRARMLSIRPQPVAIGFAQANLMSSFAAGLSRLFPKAVGLRGDPAQWEQARHFLCSGAIHPQSEHSHPGATRIFGDESIPDDRIILFEMGFLASAYSWSHGLRQGFPEAQCLGYVYDDVAHYYMADYPNRLIDRLNSDWEPSAEERARAQALIDRIVARRISKYNAQPMTPPGMRPGYARRVLVVDQSYADASTVFGRIDERGFQEMLVAAIRENPDAEIIVKTHPDTTWESEKRTGYYNHLSDYDNVRILREPVNPFSLFEHVDTVYVGVSQLGLEALFAGKKVVTFGAPFFAGWGLTDDRQEIPHRHRPRTLADLFHAFYVWYTIYHVPGRPVPSTVEDALDYIEAHRPVALLPATAPAAAPTVSVILPVYNVEDFVGDAIRSVQTQTLSDLEIIPVVDASPDNSRAVIERMAAEDPRIRPIYLDENVGQGFARNRGIEAARGTYLWFLDSDDQLCNRDFLQRAVAAAERDGSDMVRGRKACERVVDLEGRFRNDRPDPSEAHFDGLTAAGVAPAARPEIFHSRHFWLWLYRRSFLDANEIRFRTRNWEERAFLTRSILRAGRISVLDEPAVVYNVREDSTARRAKTVADARAMISNLESVVDDLIAAGASDPAHPMHGYYRFNLTQFVHYIFLGFPYRALADQADAATRSAELGRAAAAFARAGFTSERLTAAPDVVAEEDWNAGRYHLALESLLAGDETLLGLAADGRGMDQRALMRRYRAEAEPRLTRAINAYFVNERSITQRAPAAAGRRKARLVLHIGATKTGSTYLQHWLSLNRPALLRQGIYVPEIGLFRQPDRPQKTAGHAQFLVAANAGDRRPLNHIRTALAANPDIHTVLISSEAFFFCHEPAVLARYFDGFDLRVLCYLRAQDDWANSQYCEFVGGGAVRRTALGVEEWLDTAETRLCLDYALKLDLWAEQIGEAAVLARVFEPARFAGGSLLSDFAAAVGIAAPETLPDVPAALRNEAALPAPYLHLMREMNAMRFADSAQYLAFTGRVHMIAAARADGTRVRPEMLGPERRAALRAEHAAGNAAVARRFLGQADGRLFAEPAPAAAAETDGALPSEAVAEILALYREMVPQQPRPRRGDALPPVPGGAAGGRPASLAGYARLARDYLTLMRAPQFDPAWYLSRYPDVRQSRLSPRLHFLLYGGAEGRDPGPDFSVAHYLRANPDVRDSRQNALVHYLRFGRREGRGP